MNVFHYDGDLEAVRGLDYPIATAFVRNFIDGALEAFSGATHMSRPVAQTADGMTPPVAATHPVAIGGAPDRAVSAFPPRAAISRRAART